MNQKMYKLHLFAEEEGGYTVIVPSLPGCITYGETIEEAIEMSKDAITLYVEELSRWCRFKFVRKIIRDTHL
ncbi:hypothetical protein FACS189456_1370 [Bacteroidia bacterium]|nr:hypothetical protein FACS189456_1370 [Bacteroidia bacterium]